MSTPKKKKTTSKLNGAGHTKVPAAITAATPAAAGTFTICGPEERDGHTYLHRQDLLLASVMQTKTMSAIQAIALRRLQTNELVQRHERELHAAQIELLTLVAHGKELEAKTKVMWDEMGGVYKLDFGQVSYDDETGRITVHAAKELTDGTS